MLEMLLGVWIALSVVVAVGVMAGGANEPR